MATVVKEGQTVWIPCQIRNGMFPSEKYISFQVENRDSKVNALIPVEDVNEQNKTVKAVVARRANGSIFLLFRGEIYSASNPVEVPISWLAHTVL